MSDWQSVTIVGNVGRSPELQYGQDGKARCKFSVAVNDRYRDDTDWFQVTVWGKQGEACNEYLDKGSRVLVRGQVRGHAYTRKDGSPAMSLDLDAREVVFLGSTASEEHKQRGAQNGEI